MTGILIRNGDRPDIIFDNGTFYGDLHCGECFQIYDTKWISVRLEYSDDWVLVCNGHIFPITYGYKVML